jgi:hypothetical protein
MLEEGLDFRTDKSPVPTDAIREGRNLVHPARYLSYRNGKNTPLKSCALCMLLVTPLTISGTQDRKRFSDPYLATEPEYPTIVQRLPRAPST